MWRLRLEFDLNLFRGEVGAHFSVSSTVLFHCSSIFYVQVQRPTALQLLDSIRDLYRFPLFLHLSNKICTSFLYQYARPTLVDRLLQVEQTVGHINFSFLFSR